MKRGLARPAVGDEILASLWAGTAASAVDLNPSGFDFSQAFGVAGGQQVGYVFLPTAPVPEPGTFPLLGAGLAGLAGIAWRPHCRRSRPHARVATNRGMAMMKRAGLACGIAFLFLAWSPANAGPILDFTGGGPAFSLQVQTGGWRFTVTSPITVSALGLWDEAADGFAASHQLGLWSCGIGCSTGTLLASALITTANSTPVASTSPDGDWRFTPITSLTLDPGDYVVGGTFVVNDPDQVRYFTNAPSTIAGVTFDAARNGSGAGLVFPVDIPLSPGIFGPNLFGEPLAVAAPEPSALLLLGSGLAGLAGLACRRARRT